MSMFVTKTKYNKALDKIEHLEKSLAEAQNLKFVFERLTLKTEELYATCNAFSGTLSSHDLMLHLDDTVAVYTDDYFGGKVIKQEATPVTILDEKGKATYGLTKQKPDKNKEYKLVIK